MSILSRLGLAETPRRPDTVEHGDNAVSYLTGVPGDSRRLRDPEYRYELRGRQGGRTYQRMRWSDPHIAGLRMAQNLGLLRASAAIEPAVKVETEPGYADAKAKTELVERLLLNDFPWRSFLADSCLCMDYGFAPFEIVWRIQDGEARFRLALRPADSIMAQDIFVKDGAIDHVIQRPETGGEFPIPGENLVWFAHDKEGDSFAGRPILRAMYKPWKIKEELEMDLPELIRKLGGIPDIKTLEEPADDLATKLDTMGANFGVQPGSFMRHTQDVEVTLLTGSAQVKDVLDAIQQRNTEITAVCQGQVFDLGTSNSGSRALGRTLADLFSDSIQTQASYREDVLNAQGGLIHQVITYNFPRDDNLPKLRFGNVLRADMQAFAQAMLWFSQAFGSLDEETQEWARAEMNMPEGAVSQIVLPEKTAPPVAAPVVPATPDGGPTGGASVDAGAKASERHTHGLQLAEMRAPQGVECYLNLAELVGQFDDSKTAIAQATADTRAALVAELGRRARAAAAKGDLAKFAAGMPPMIDKLSAEILAVLSDFHAKGSQQVADELQRQRDGTPAVADAIAARQAGQRVIAAETPPTAGLVASALAAIRQQAEATARTIAATIQAAATGQAARTATVPLADAAFDEAVSRESDAAALRVAGVVSDVMQAGRAQEATAQAQEIEDAVYSAILDGACCDACEPMDGETTTDLSEAEDWCPNPDCAGGDRCRCLAVYEIRQETP